MVGPSGQNWATGFCVFPGGEPELSARSSCWKKQTFTPGTWKGKVLTLSFIQPRPETNAARLLGSTHSACWNLAHFGISCSKRRRLPKGSIVYITFAPYGAISRAGWLYL